MAERWIQGAVRHKGALHRALHVPEGEKIPAEKMAKARRSVNPRIRQMAGLARTLKGFHHAKGGAVIQGEGEAPKARGDRARRGR
jgi:hypothetical protein